jgi:ferredoxin
MDDAKKKMGPVIKVLPDKCRGCLLCELRCAFRFEKQFLLNSSRIKVRRCRDLTYEIKFGSGCDRCGICARSCMYGALIQESIKEDEP